MRIAFVTTPNMLATTFVNAFELFFAANQSARALGTLPMRAELVAVGTGSDILVRESGLSISTQKLEQAGQFDMIYLPAMWRNPRPIVRNNRELIDWLQRQYENGAILNSTGTGVWFTASAGLLDGRSATTHWYFFERFAHDFPKVHLKRQHFITKAGNIYCAGSSNALTDLTLHHVHRFYGKDVSEHLSLHFSHEVRQPFHELSFNEERNSNHPDEQILQVQLWIQNNLSRNDITVTEIADHFGMSLRNLGRRFKEATSMTPIEYLQERRSLAAKELLQTSNLSIKEVAYRVGYLDVSYFSNKFRQNTSLTPRAYRNTFRARLYKTQTGQN